jgi:cell division protease FtsH
MKPKFKKSSYFSGGPKNVLIAALIFLASIVVLTKLVDHTIKVRNIPYSSFLKRVEQGDVKAVHFAGQDVYGSFKDGSKFESAVPVNNPRHFDILKENGVEFSVASQSNNLNIWYLLPLLLLGVVLIGAWYFFRQSRGGTSSEGGNNIFTMGKSKAKMFLPSTIKENFESVAGATEAKEELKDLVDFLKNPEKYQRLGAKITRGVLLIGEPGNGKTLLARAVAGEANCPFFAISGSDFIEVFVGIGAARVRDLFAQARKNAPSIIFIDEIDAVGRHRGSGLGGGHDEREQTLNQLLTEMDGFQTGGGAVIVLAATNRPDVLDKALLRPGRFDRRVYVPFPDMPSREQILKVHAKEVKMNTEVDLQKIARATPGFSGADLANLINEAAIHASKANQDNILIKDFEEARDKMIMGKESKKIMTEEERKMTAYHEAGHALIRLLLPTDTDPLHKVTIIPRGASLGATHFLPERDKYLRSKEEMLANIRTGLGGRVAEELVFGKLTTGAQNDFVGVTNIARDMVCNYGMTDELGTVIYTQKDDTMTYSQKTAERIDEAIQQLIADGYKDTVEILKANRDKLNILAEALLEKETLDASEIYELLGIEPRTLHKF